MGLKTGCLVSKAAPAAAPRRELMKEGKTKKAGGVSLFCRLLADCSACQQHSVAIYGHSPGQDPLCSASQTTLTPQGILLWGQS